jgi:predicted XRE-type DNA-binding protein
MKIRKITFNNHKKSFAVSTSDKTFPFPYAQLELQPTPADRITGIRIEKELANEAFTYVLESGKEGTIHIDQVLEYNRDPAYMKDLLLYRLTLEVENRIKTSSLSKREIIRRLGTSASQFYRLLDPTNYRKSFGQLFSLLQILGYEVDLVVREKTRRIA